jgi:hypothetical protein
MWHNFVRQQDQSMNDQLHARNYLMKHRETKRHLMGIVQCVLVAELGPVVPGLFPLHIFIELEEVCSVFADSLADVELVIAYLCKLDEIRPSLFHRTPYRYRRSIWILVPRLFHFPRVGLPKYKRVAVWLGSI